MFIRCRKLNISLLFITQSSFSVPKDVRLNSTHYLIIKIINKKELQNIAIKKIFIIKISWRFTESVQNNRILSWQLIKHCAQRTPWDLGKVCFNLIKMTVADQIKILDKKTKRNEVHMIYTEKQLNYLHSFLITWINMNILLVKIWDTNQV